MTRSSRARRTDARVDRRDTTAKLIVVTTPQASARTSTGCWQPPSAAPIAQLCGPPGRIHHEGAAAHSGGSMRVAVEGGWSPSVTRFWARFRAYRRLGAAAYHADCAGGL